MFLRCVDCAARFPAEMRYACARCGGIPEVAEPACLAHPIPEAGMWSGKAALGATGTARAGGTRPWPIRSAEKEKVE